MLLEIGNKFRQPRSANKPKRSACDNILSDSDVPICKLHSTDDIFAAIASVLESYTFIKIYVHTLIFNKTITLTFLLQANNRFLGLVLGSVEAVSAFRRIVQEEI